ncbi:MAG: efflux RND transporter periplasmic adaptor subunit, partial [Pseudomonadota bacterium]
ARLGIAERDRAKATLAAPFDGVISLRDVDPFVELSAGQPIFQIDSEGAFEVALSIPDTVVGQLNIGGPVTVETTGSDLCGCTGRITEIGAAAGVANAVPVTATLLDAPNGVLPGMAVEAAVAFDAGAASRGFLVPLVAIAPGDDEARGYVFKFDAAAGVVRRTAVTGAGVIDGNFIGVADGVAAGDVIAAAGVSLLRDGQPVTLLSR